MFVKLGERTVLLDLYLYHFSIDTHAFVVAQSLFFRA